MTWIRENWFWITVLILFLWMHGKMHGSMHGGHGHQGHGGSRPPERDGHPRDDRATGHSPADPREDPDAQH